MAKAEKKVSELSEKELIELGKKVRDIYESGHIGVQRMFWLNILRGVAYGLGFFIGGTVIVALLIWLLGQFEQVPFLQSLLRAIQNSM